MHAYHNFDKSATALQQSVGFRLTGVATCSSWVVVTSQARVLVPVCILDVCVMIKIHPGRIQDFTYVIGYTISWICLNVCFNCNL